MERRLSVLTGIGFEHRPPNALQRLVQNLAASKKGSALFSRVLRPVDDAVFKLTDGRATLASLAAGVPIVMLTTIGARSDLPRTTPLIGIPFGENLAVIGSNWGGTFNPAWVHNLRNNPGAQVSYRRNSVSVWARPATTQETDQIFEVAGSIYPGYPRYRERASHRVINVFVLHPAEPGVG
jgi:deazaflavin-dependent oxidoreductase (nitroreductase family)